ncbi:MAG: 50S ribosomal protein L18 [Acidobacteriota bacterium]|nr:50S ribosomal protein L18 [Acidobacteriota bacterium]MDE2964217.1 50S ribosomal protein L18 [Acidobacteriota bacterium]
MAKRISRGHIRKRIHVRVRKKIRGSGDRPRLNVFRSASHIYAQVIDDDQGRTLASASTVDKEIREQNRNGGNLAAARVVGSRIAERASRIGIKRVVYDRGGYLFHGRVKALADAAREGGLEF